MIYRNAKSCGTPETNIMLCVSYTSKKKKGSYATTTNLIEVSTWASFKGLGYSVARELHEVLEIVYHDLGGDFVGRSC